MYWYTMVYAVSFSLLNDCASKHGKLAEHLSAVNIFNALLF